MQAKPDMVKPVISSPIEAIVMPSRIEFTRRILATRCETHTTQKMMRKELALTIHSCVIMVPRDVCTVNIAGK